MRCETKDVPELGLVESELRFDSEGKSYVFLNSSENLFLEDFCVLLHDALSVRYLHIINDDEKSILKHRKYNYIKLKPFSYLLMKYMGIFIIVDDIDQMDQLIDDEEMITKIINS